jgi:hypothetical protein
MGKLQHVSASNIVLARNGKPRLSMTLAIAKVFLSMISLGSLIHQLSLSEQYITYTLINRSS